MDFISILSIFVLACFVGYYVVWSVTPALHTPLMAVTNAISSVIVVGALIAAAAGGSPSAKWLGLLAVALGLLGLGWNLGLIGGTALVTDGTPLATRARTQGAVDLAVALAGAAGGISSGLVVETTGFAALALAAGLVALLLVPVLARARPAPAMPA